ncbi:MAG: dual specificity protein phosphatase family protein [Thermoplasmata archaeon]|nr:dual specificity protein phosphatase family protein [Thermoplasmata archaeon]
MTATKSRTRAAPPANKTSASLIAPGVYVGGWDDAVAFEGTRICVLDEAPKEKPPAESHLPIYEEKGDRPLIENLDRVWHQVDVARSKDQPVLLFCGHGIRRGSLAGAWYLHRHEGLSVDAAYAKVKAVRPKIQHAREWIGHWELLNEA